MVLWMERAFANDGIIVLVTVTQYRHWKYNPSIHAKSSGAWRTRCAAVIANNHILFSLQ